MSNPTSLPPAGWYSDPQGGDGQRWWNGAAWSDETHPGAQQSYPGAQQGYPSAQQGYPSAQQAYPGAQQAYPSTQQGYGGYAVTPPIGAWRSPADDRPVVTNPIDAVRTVFQQYARFDGRAGRPEFWWWVLANTIIGVACYVIGLVMILVAAGASAGYGNGGAGALSIVGSLFILLLVAWELAVLVPSLAVLVRRLRDAGFHWGFIFLSLVPGGSIAVLVMCCMPSKYP